MVFLKISVIISFTADIDTWEIWSKIPLTILCIF